MVEEKSDLEKEELASEKSLHSSPLESVTSGVDMSQATCWDDMQQWIGTNLLNLEQHRSRSFTMVKLQRFFCLIGILL